MRVEAAVAQLAGAGPVVLAVSGGLDSTVLMHAAARAPGVQVAAVATFDHGTGPAATRAAARVVREARAMGLASRRGRARTRLRGEAEWRAARFAFLRRVAREFRASIATAHSRDDHLETVVLRALRGSGARGLAGLLAWGRTRRPMVRCSRADILGYAHEHGLTWSEDPTNASRAHLRNRVRLDLLPALEHAHPGFGAEMLAVAERAAALRAEIGALITRELGGVFIESDRTRTTISVARAPLLHYDANGLVWPEIAAQGGLVLDRRGVARLVSLARDGRPGARIPLAGGFEALIHRDQILLRREIAAPVATKPVRLRDGMARLGAWRVRSCVRGSDSLWTAAFPANAALTLRAWSPGDRMTPAGASVPRRVKGLLRDAGIDATRRLGWPVVLAGDEIVWIPGVRRSASAFTPPGPDTLSLFCEPG